MGGRGMGRQVVDDSEGLQGWSARHLHWAGRRKARSWKRRLRCACQLRSERWRQECSWVGEEERKEERLRSARRVDAWALSTCLSNHDSSDGTLLSLPLPHSANAGQHRLQCPVGILEGVSGVTLRSTSSRMGRIVRILSF